jgi:IMP dehydrogenase/GMP reductase
MRDKQQEATSAGTEGGRRPTGVPADVNGKPDPEVVVQMTRRRINNSYKLKVLNHVDSLRDDGNGAIGAYLRKEGLYYSMVHNWSKQRDEGLLRGHSNANSREKNRDAILAENKQLRRKLEQTEKRLHKTELLVELQKKLSAFMEMDAQKVTEKSAAQ